MDARTAVARDRLNKRWKRQQEARQGKHITGPELQQPRNIIWSANLNVIKMRNIIKYKRMLALAQSDPPRSTSCEAKL